MLFSELTVSSRRQEYTQEFRGYNHNLRIADGEFWNMQNLSSDAYPIMRPKRDISLVTSAGLEVRGVYVKGGHLIHVVAGSVYVDGKNVELTIQGGALKIVGIGVYVVFFPGGEYFDLQAFLAGGEYDKGKISARVDISCGTVDPDTGDTPIVWFLPCMADGTTYETFTYEEPDSPTEGMLWIDTSGEDTVAKIYDAERSMWVLVSQMYVKIDGPGIGAQFRKGDGVTISGALPNDTTGEHKKVVNGSFTLTEVGTDFIIIPGLLPAVMRQAEGTVTVKREFPQMDYVVECNNRLWGCKHGEVYVDGKKTYVNEIYACALGDFLNWNKYEGLSTDSYTASRGTDGPWTGAIVYQGNPMFFKADSVDVVSVSSTGAHQITTRQMRGLQASESGTSLAIVDDVLYWSTGREVVAYNGTYPESISAPLGLDPWSNAVGGALGHKYYICIDGTIYVYDTSLGVWHRENEFAVSMFAYDMEHLYAAEENHIWSMASGSRDVFWLAETGEIGLSLPGRKYVSRLNLRMAAPRGAWVDVYVQYDSGRWQRKGRINGSEKIRSKIFPIVPVRCDHMKIRLVGQGDVKIYSLGKITEEGSDYL